MKIIEVQRGNATVQLSEIELLILNNALNEVCNASEVPEFATRLGATIVEVRNFLKEVNGLLGHHVLKQERLA